MKANQDSKIIIDASGKSFGRLASLVATKLQGKDNPFFVRNRVIGPKVKVINLGRIKFTGKKFSKKVYYRHTGYIGHLKAEKLSFLWQKKPKEVFRRAVSGMLPKNKLRKRYLKRLEVEL